MTWELGQALHVVRQLAFRTEAGIHPWGPMSACLMG